MKNKIPLLAAACFSAAILLGAPALTAKPTVQIIFDHPENFTDVKDGFSPTDKGVQANLDIIKDYLEQHAARYLSDGQTLTITFTNIDLAGDFEPQHGPEAQDVRVIKDIYPPRLDFSYKLVDANNAVLKEGQEKLRDLGFQMRLNPINASEQFPYEKDMLNDWLHSTFGKNKKK